MSEKQIHIFMIGFFFTESVIKKSTGI